MMMMLSQEVEALRDISLRNVGLNRLAHQLRQLIRALQAGRHLHCALPVVVVKALLVGELRQTLLRNLGIVVHHDVVGWRASALGHLLCRQMEVQQLIHRNLVEDTGAG
jgi:hypothetical protein